MRFAKGHGTENDFVIVLDPDNEVDLAPGLVARLCDRRAGLGADGVLRAVRTSALPGPAGAAYDSTAAAAASTAGWFMDYRNADGSVAEMCGNGIRVFARFLLDHELVDGPEFAVATRAGTRLVRAEPDGDITVDMGQPLVLGDGRAELGGEELDGLQVSLGNPHLACVVDRPLAEFDLSRPPALDAEQFPDGANLELVRLAGNGHILMRVYERGSGATRSCGTGAVAAAVAAAAALATAGDVPRDSDVPPDRDSDELPGRDGLPVAGTLAGGLWVVDVPGGRLRVTLDAATSFLSGPAVIVAEGTLDEAWLSGKRLTPDQSSPAV
jgi:diaminopimelate epimerase